jgi:diamine N-acetyltransferase
VDETIRPADAHDVPALAELASRTWSDAFGDSVAPDELAVELEEKRSAAYFDAVLRTDTILVAESSSALIGYVQFGDVNISELEPRPGDQELHRLYVATDLQGQGVGRRLTEAALRHPRLAGASRIYLQVWEANERAILLYESLGFEAVGRTTFTIGSGHVTEDLVMRLERGR